MAIIQPSQYRPSRLWRGGHIQTIRSNFRKVDPLVPPTRERISTPDQDFLDLDWFFASREKEGPGGSDLRTPKRRGKKAEKPALVILSHGLEGFSRRPYMLGMANRFLAHRGPGSEPVDVLAWNYRGCSGELNHTPYFYHSGATADLDVVLRHAYKRGYQKIFLIGFSLGGNLTLKYMGERGGRLSKKIVGGAALSAPVHLESCARQLARRSNTVYMQSFLKSLRTKVYAKEELFPGSFDTRGLDKIKTFAEYDGQIIAPLYGFRDALDYWEQSSALYVLRNIRRPTLLINAWDDPFLAPDCYPVGLARHHEFFHLEKTDRGGHIGFIPSGSRQTHWSERRVLRFFQEQGLLR